MKNFKPEMLGNPDLSQRVLDLQAGISSAPASMVNNEKKHLLGLFDAIDELGELYGVHRATAARWLHAAKERIMLETRARFAAKSRASQTECDSMFRMISSHLDLSIRRHLVA
jgi:RNA polymerase sigma-70 factor (ECF subfamily)